MHSIVFAKSSRPLLRSLVLIAACLLLADSARADDTKSIKGFRDAIVALGPDVDPAEAELVSVTAHTTARRLQKEWRVAPVSIYQNFLIHIGARERGYCFHWAHDIGAQLKTLPLKTLELHWAEAYANKRLEHNVVVVKFWLAISKEEQYKRFKAREGVSFKRFKITAEDWRNRKKWNDYEIAVSEMVDRTSTATAPWTLVEANNKYFARIKVLKTLVTALESGLQRVGRKSKNLR